MKCYKKSQWTIGLNVRVKIIKFPEENIEKYHHNLRVDGNFLHSIQRKTNRTSLKFQALAHQKILKK